MTVAGSEDRKSGLTMVGVAAHITAAAPGGPRYDPSMSHAERSSESNGIWTCQTHSKFIDDNPSSCTIEELHRWKRQHEAWVFDRVATGDELLSFGLTRLRFCNVGVFHEKKDIKLGRHNVLVGPNEAGKTTICQIAAAFAGGAHWTRFNSRFKFAQAATMRSLISAKSSSGVYTRSVTLSPQSSPLKSKSRVRMASRLLVEVDGNVAADWPRNMFRALHFDEQLEQPVGGPKRTFDRGLRYLEETFSLERQVLLDSLREETYANSPLGFRFRPAGASRVEVLVPDGRDFFLPTSSLSSSELRLALIDIALKLVLCTAPNDQWLIIFDTDFFGRLDRNAKASLFHALTSITERPVQTIFCLSIDQDAEALRQANLENGIGGSSIGSMTLHSFI